MKPRILLLTALFLLAMTILMSCSESTSPPLRLGTNRWPGYEPLYLAGELGFLNTDQVRLVEYPTATEVMYAMRNRSIELAALTMDEALVLIQDGVDIKIVLIFDFSSGGDAVIGKPEIQNLSQLKGKRIAYESSAVGAIMMDALLEKAELSIDQVILLHRTVNHHLQVYDQNEADVIVTFEPVVSELLAKGGRRLLDSKVIPGRIVDVLAIHSDILEQHNLKVRQLVNAWFQALDQMKNESVKVMPILAKRLGLTTRQMEETFKGLRLLSREINKDYLLRSNKLKKQSEKLQLLMLKRGLLRHQVKLENVFDGSIL